MEFTKIKNQSIQVLGVCKHQFNNNFFNVKQNVIISKMTLTTKNLRIVPEMFLLEFWIINKTTDLLFGVSGVSKEHSDN